MKNGRRNQDQVLKEKKKTTKIKQSYQQNIREFNEKLKKYQLYIEEVQADGNCLFRAIADQLDENELNHEFYRSVATSQIKKKKNFYKEFLPEEIPIDYYIQKMSQDGVWGGHIELQAISDALGIQIVVHSLDTFVVIGRIQESDKKYSCLCCLRILKPCAYYLSCYCIEKILNKVQERTIHLAYHKSEYFEEHYSSIGGDIESFKVYMNISPQNHQIQYYEEESSSLDSQKQSKILNQF